MKENARRPARWKTLLGGLVLLGGAVLYVRFGPHLADSMYRSGLMVLGLLLLALWIPAWTLLLSGLHWKVRLLVLAGLAVGAGALGSAVRIDGFEGDILPQIGWRWQPRPGEVYDELELAAAAWCTEVPGALDVREFLGDGGTNSIPAALVPDVLGSTVPTEVWRRRVGLGWSSFAVAQGLVITQEQRGDEECTVAYTLDDGTAVWTNRHAARFTESMGGDGPRATPTIRGERVFALGATGILDCLALRTGEVQWSHDTLVEAGHANLEWGKSGSPLVVGDLVVVALGVGGGGTLAAFDAASGEPRWRAGEFEASYSTPVLRTIDGVEQLVVVYAAHLAGHDKETGEVLWSTAIPRAAANVANPVVLAPNRVLVSIGYGKGSRLFEVARDDHDVWQVAEVWRSMAMKPKFTNLVVRGSLAFGLDEGRLACIDLATGRRVWKGSRFGHGQVLGVGERLLVQAEDGEEVVVGVSDAGEEVLQRFAALDGKTWNQPVLAGRYLLVRNDREAACFVYPASN